MIGTTRSRFNVSRNTTSFNSRDILRLLLILVLALCPVITAKCQTTEQRDPQSANGGKRVVTVADAVTMSEVVDPTTGNIPGSSDDVPLFSPDGKKVVILVRQGNLEKNTNDYSILLWNTSDLVHSRTPEKLAILSSSSNRPAIEHITWLPNSQALLFLGEHPGELHQLYRFSIRSHRLKRLTDHATNLVGYSSTPNGEQIAYTAEEAPKGFFDDDKLRRNGLVVSRQMLYDLFLDNNKRILGGVELFIKKGNQPAHRVLLRSEMVLAGPRPWPALSPDGKQVVITEYIDHRPDAWRVYTAPLLRTSTFFYAYVLVDLSTGRSRALMDFPQEGLSIPLWVKDSHRLVLSGVFLPIEQTEGPERQERESKSFTVELEVSTGKFEKISGEHLLAVGWDEKNGDLILRKAGLDDYNFVSTMVMRKTGSKWEKVGDEVVGAGTQPQFSLEQDMNTPPKIFVIDRATHNRALLLVLNPQFTDLRFGKVEEITWTAKGGHRVGGELYYPVDYAPKRRYPLVMQTHGASGSNLFSLIGLPIGSPNAAQPLAGKGIMVLQLGEEAQDDRFGYMAKYFDTPQEAVLAMGVYESAVDYLDERGLIDKDLVGLVGFSRTCLYVKYTLTHSKYHFSASVVQDGIDGGYFTYIAINYPPVEKMEEGLNGGVPFAEGLKSWVEKSPAFNIGRVDTPLRIIANNRPSLLGEWEWFAALSRLGKPVEFVMMQDAAHIVRRPWDRMVSQQGNVDWFRFWLQDYEDPDPAKADQYARWRELRKLQEKNAKQPQKINPSSIH